jgi:hypothetical protein
VARVGLGQTLHVIDELTGHKRPALLLGAAAKALISGKSGADVAT